MKIDIEIPDESGEQLQEAWCDLPRRALEAIAVEAHRWGALSRGSLEIYSDSHLGKLGPSLKSIKPSSTMASKI
jgi:hypothetical protein